MRDAADVRAKRVEATMAGLSTLRRALPQVLAVQRRLVGEEGQVGGRLRTALLRLGQAARADEDPLTHRPQV